MSDVYLVDPHDWKYDLQSVYSAYMGHFQLHSIPWHDRTWGQFFESFEQFLAFSWPVITVTDARTRRAHIVTRMSSIVAFAKMIKTRFGETLPQVDNMLLVRPFETSQRQLWHVNDWSTYKKLHSALPAITLAAFKARVRAGDPSATRELWAMRDKTFLAVDFESFERNDHSWIEWGYAAIRSSHLEAAGAWPPVPNTNYRKGHYVISEHTQVPDKASPGVSRQFGETQVIPKAKMPRIVQSILSLISPDSETVVNNVVLIGHGIQAIMQHLEEMKIKLPKNVLVVDIAYLERALFTTGERGSMQDRKTGRARLPESLLSLGGLLRSFGIDPQCVLHNAGNNAFMALVAFQRMMDSRGANVTSSVGVGVGSGEGKGDAPASNGSGHISRAATVAARLFRPRESTQSDAGAKGNANGNGNEDLRRLSVGIRVDEMGMNVNVKRASMFNTLTPAMVPTDKIKKRASGASIGGNGFANVWWSPSVTVSGQRLQSVTEMQQREGRV